MSKPSSKPWMPALRLMFALTVLTGLIYPGLVSLVCQAMFPTAANGSLIVRHGQVVGSRLIGQGFSRPEYFHPRPSAAGADGYDAAASNGTNLGPTSQKLMLAVQANLARFRQENPAFRGPVPADMVTASGSGLDPDISPASALAQAARVAQARGATVAQIEQLIAHGTQGPTFGLLGDARVNVLVLNLALDRAFPRK